MTNTETDNLREQILQTFCNAICCGDCGKIIGYAEHYYSTQDNILCNSCLARALEWAYLLNFKRHYQ